MKNYLTLISTLLFLAPAAHAELTELARLYGPPEGTGFYHICAPGDVNGDGFDDFIISSPTRNREVRECENGYARLYFGSNPIDTSNYITIPAVCNEYQTPYDNLFGYHSAKVGDINNDGFADFLIGDPGYFNYWTERAGAGFVYFGGPAIDTLPSWQLIGDWWYGATYFYGDGDVNGDQYNDVVMGITDHFPHMPAYIFLGGESPDTLYDFKLGPYHPDSSVISKPRIIGDYNGDGIDDIIIGDPDYGGGGSNGMAYMYFGSETGFYDPDLIFEHRGGWTFGIMTYGTDWNNDGYTDLFIACSQDSVFGYKGSENPDATCDVIFTSEPWNFGERISGGDLNGDGYPDLAISYNDWTGAYLAQGRVLIYYGGDQPDTIPDVIICGAEEYQFFGKEIAFPGDINGDGYQEFMASSFFRFDQTRAFVTIFTTGDVSVPDDGRVPNEYDYNLTSYPNPFNSSTNIEFFLPLSSSVKVTVYNLSGREVIVLEDSVRPKGKNRITWEGKDEQGNKLSSGVYFIVLKTEYAVSSCKAVIIK
jgi:hypothetical protein